MSQSDFSVMANGQTKKEVDGWTKKPPQEQRQNAFTDFTERYKMTYKRVIHKKHE